MALSFSQQSISDGNPIYGSRYKVVGDPLHRMITLDDALLQIIDTPQFQRLRDLKQLGTAYYVFPGASHNRFEHSLGVSYLSSQMIDFLCASSPTLRVTDEEKMYVRIAGAVHDLGHGPFSHVWDGMFVPMARPDRPDWSHEQMSLDLFELLIDENSIDVLDGTPEGCGDYKYGRKMVQQMVFGAKSNLGKGLMAVDEKPFLFEIVANGRTGIDTDKFDYLARDTYNVGLQSSFDHKRLLYSAKVVGGYVAHHAKECLSVYELFHTRYMLFKQIYVHRATKAVELMVTDIMLEANAAWGGALAAAIDDPKEYMLQTDCLLREIERSKDRSLAKARAILEDLRKRRLYRFVDEYLLPVDGMATLKKVTAFDIASHNVDPSISIDPTTVVVHDTKFNYGKGKENPVDHCIFYRDPLDDRGFHIRSDRVSHILPSVFEERVVRVYTKINDASFINAVQKAFRRFLKVHLGSVPMAPDPSSKVFASQVSDVDYDVGSPVVGDSCPSGTRPRAIDSFHHGDDDRVEGGVGMYSSQRSTGARPLPAAPAVAVHGFSRLSSPARTKSLTRTSSSAVRHVATDDEYQSDHNGHIFQLPASQPAAAAREVPPPHPEPHALPRHAQPPQHISGKKRSGSGIAAYFQRNESITTEDSQSSGPDLHDAKKSRIS